MKNKCLVLFIALVVLLALLISIVVYLKACCKPYDEKWIIGKTSDEIMERYGKFDIVMNKPSEDGLYRNQRCGYKTKSGNIDWYDEFYMISFNSQGVAYLIEEDVCRPGG